MPVGAGLLPDFMRGEETQVLGALEQNASKSDAVGSDTLIDFTKTANNPQTDRSNPELFVLPGSHSKWLDVVDNTITQFETHFSGELFAVLKEHSILGRLFESGKAQDVSPDLVAARTKAFELGIQSARIHPNSLLQHLFSTRALGLDGQLSPGAGESFLSGLLIGHEITSALASRAKISKINLIGSRELCERYAQALKQFHVSSETLLDTAAPGLWRLAQAAHLI
jgi:2-dehydro-3-deoxygalactonokinase